MGLVAKSGHWLSSFLKRIIIYALSLCIVLALVAGGAFYFFRSSLTDYAAKQIKSYGIETATLEISPLGKANITGMRIAMGDDGELTAARASVRPPVSGVSGTVSLYSVVLKRGNLLVTMPELHVDGLSLKAKDSTISSRTLQTLLRVGVSSVTIPRMQVTLTNDSGQQDGKTGEASLRDVKLVGMYKGEIGRVTAGRLDATMQDAKKQQRIVAHGDNFAAGKIDLAGAYNILSGHMGAGKTILGEALGHGMRVQLESLKPDVENSAGQTIKLSLGSVELKPVQWNKKLPQSLRLAMQDFNFDTAQLSPDAAGVLHRLGYDRLDMSLLFDVAYDEAARKLTVKDFSFSDPQMGSFSFSSVMDNVGKDVFSGDKQKVRDALAEAKFVQLTMSLLNEGLIDRLTSTETASALLGFHISGEELRGYVNDLVQESADTFLANRADQAAMTQALLDFVRAQDTARLKIDVAAKQPGGLRFADMLADDNGAQAPDATGDDVNMLDVLNKFDLSITRQK